MARAMAVSTVTVGNGRVKTMSTGNGKTTVANLNHWLRRLRAAGFRGLHSILIIGQDGCSQHTSLMGADAQGVMHRWLTISAPQGQL